MAPTADCRFGERCTKPGCSFRHPAKAWVACGKFGDKHCRDGVDCGNAKCGFAHPANWPLLTSKACAPAAKPPPEEWVPCGKFGDKRCREGGACTNRTCGFAHPAMWVQQMQAPKPTAAPPVTWIACGKFGERHCRDAGQCRNAQCGFAHPSDWLHFHGEFLHSTASEYGSSAISRMAQPGMGGPSGAGGGPPPPTMSAPATGPWAQAAQFDDAFSAGMAGPTDEELEWMASCIGDHSGSPEELEWMAACVEEQEAMAAAGMAAGTDCGGGYGLMNEEEGVWLEEQMNAMQLQSSGASGSSGPPGAAKSTAPSFIESNFTSRAEYEAWVEAGADLASLP